jgi:hypothetical protein
MWRRRAADRVQSAVRLGRTTMEGRILLADAAAIRQCAAELTAALAQGQPPPPAASPAP